MAKSIARSSEGASNANMYAALQKIQRAICDRIFNSAGLVIGSSSKPKIKIANTIYGKVDGTLISKATAEIVISGTIANAAFNVYVLTINSAGTVTATMGTAGASLAAVVFPTVPDDEAVIGYVIVNPTGTGDFVGGTTDLDDATVTPGALYVNTQGVCNPNAETFV